jgi:hypothetical protein
VTDISNDQQLSAAIRQAGDLLQSAQDYLGRRHSDSGRVRFPRRYLRTASDWRKKLGFVRSGSVRNNVAYSLMLFDVHLWILHRTDLAGTASLMVVKATLATAGSIVEALLIDHYSGVMGKRQPFKARTKRLVDDGVIAAPLRAELDWLWDMRCRQHLFEISASEFDFYSLVDHKRAVGALGELMTKLQVAYDAIEPAF